MRKFGDAKLPITNVAPKNFEYHNEVLNILVQALRSIGEDNVTENMKSRIPNILKDVPKDKKLESDLTIAPAWIRKIIHEMIKEDD